MVHHTENRRRIHKRRILTYKIRIEGCDSAARERNEPDEVQHVVILLAYEQRYGQNVARRAAKAVGYKLLPIWRVILENERQSVGEYNNE
jgi:hypothetical protein